MVHSEKGNLDWTIRLLWTPTAIRPIGPKQIYEGSVGTGVHQTTPRGGLNTGYGFMVMPFSVLIFLIFVVPVMLVVLPLRYARVLPWQIEAVTYPWGKRKGPATVLRWRVKGRREDLERAVNEIAAGLERGDVAPKISGAVRD